MKIKRLYVKNGGPLEDVCIDFTNTEGNPYDMILLAGANGTGKTTILEIIVNLLALLHWDCKSEDFKDTILERTEFCQLDVVHGDRLISIYKGDQNLIEKDMEVDNDKQIPHPNAPGDDYGDERDKHIHEYIRKIGKNIKSNEGEKIMFGENNINISNIIYFPQYRYIRRVDLNEVEKAYTLFNYMFYYGDDLISKKPRIASSITSVYKPLNSFFVWLEYASPEQFEKVTQYINTELFTDKNLFKIEREHLKAYIKTYNGNTHALDYLSSGEQNILILALELKRHINENSIILIDEIENSLHNQYQQRIMEIIIKLQKTTKCQFIITSHSEHIKNYFKPKAASKDYTNTKEDIGNYKNKEMDVKNSINDKCFLLLT